MLVACDANCGVGDDESGDADGDSVGSERNRNGNELDVCNAYYAFS